MEPAKFFSSKKLFIIIIVILLLIVLAVDYLVYSKRSKPTQNAAQSSQQTTNANLKTFKTAQGIIDKVNADFIVLTDDKQSQIQIFTSNQTSMVTQIIKTADQKSSSDSAKLLYSLVSKQNSTLKDLKAKDKVTVVVDEKKGQLQAQSITIFKEKTQ